MLSSSSILFQGVSDNIFGPTLLDFTSIYDTKVSVISFVVLFRFGGSILGTTIAGIVLDKCLKYRYFILFGYTFIIGFTNVVLPHLPNIWLFFTVMTFSCFASGSLDTGGNVLILDLNGDSGPYLHSIHFSYALGSFIAPVIAIPYLSQTNTQITTLFPILGTSIVIISTGYIIAGILMKSSSNPTKEVQPCKKESYGSHVWSLLIIISLFFFFYVGAEVSYAIYIATFAVECDQHLSETQGAEITSIFWACFALMRFISIFTSIYLKPIYILIFSFVMSWLGAISLIFYGNENLVVLQIGSALIGFGMAAIYATGLLWLETYVKITNRIGAAMSCMSGIGYNLFLVFIGQYLTEFPMILMYVTGGSIMLCTIMFGVAFYLGKLIEIDKIKQNNNEKELKFLE